MKLLVVAAAVAMIAAAFIPGQAPGYLTEDAEAQWLPPGQMRAHKARSRPNDYFPQHRDASAVKAVDEVLGVDAALANLELTINVPAPTSEGLVALDDIAKMQPKIKGRSAIIDLQLQPQSSTLQARLINGQMFVYGSLLGEMTYKNGAKAEVTIGVAALPGRDQAHFSVMLAMPQATLPNVLPVHVTFGNLEPTAELLQAMQPTQ